MMHQTGNMPCHRFARLEANGGSGSGPYNPIAGSNSAHAFPHHLHPPPPPGAYPYYPQYYGPTPPSTVTFHNPERTEDTDSPGSTEEHPPTHPIPPVPFQFGHQYHHHHHPTYPPQSQYYNQFYDHSGHMGIGQTSTSDEMNKNDALPDRIGIERNNDQLLARTDEKSLSEQDDDRDGHSDD
jgi:hypothetical protein